MSFRRSMLTGTMAIHALAMGIGGTLLFLVQPLYAKMLLPIFGGAPAVWNTAMLFYQVALLAGYLYAHALARWLPIRTQVLVHLGLVMMPLLVLPVRVPSVATVSGERDPVPRLLASLVIGVGLPYFVVATTSPLLQSWFTRATARTGSDPYLLYVASNVGSMLALLAYPLLLEPRLALSAQSALWTVGYAAFVVALAACGVVLLRASKQAANQVRDSSAVSGARIPWKRRARWVLLALVPSSLMLSVTTHMTTTIAPLPLLWVLPLALYLLTFIVAFATRRVVATVTLRRLMPLVLLPVLVITVSGLSSPVFPLMAVHVAAFTLLALICHAELATDAPAGEHLTEFYLWMSIGGALGGAFNALVAPRVFDRILEYPLALVAVALLIPRVVHIDDAQAPRSPQVDRAGDVAMGVGLGALVLACHAALRYFDLGTGAGARSLSLGIGALVAFGFAERRTRFALAVAGLFVAGTSIAENRRVILAERSFFGVSRVFVTGKAPFHEFVHGSISHGAQNQRDGFRREPLTYYARSGPAGQLVLARQAESDVRRVAVVGLGAGSLACYKRPGERWTFFEIDELVIRIARDARYFSYLRDCAPDALVVLGDARLSLQQSTASGFDIMLLDAYSADAIPVHLVTREALALYRRTLAPGGVIAFHISNRYFDLAPVIGVLARDAGMAVRIRSDAGLTDFEARSGKSESVWMLVAERSTDLGSLAADARWTPYVAPASFRVWTDEFSSTLSALR